MVAPLLLFLFLASGLLSEKKEEEEGGAKLRLDEKFDFLKGAPRPECVFVLHVTLWVCFCIFLCFRVKACKEEGRI